MRMSEEITSADGRLTSAFARRGRILSRETNSASRRNFPASLRVRASSSRSAYGLPKCTSRTDMFEGFSFRSKGFVMGSALSSDDAGKSLAIFITLSRSVLTPRTFSDFMKGRPSIPERTKSQSGLTEA